MARTKTDIFSLPLFLELDCNNETTDLDTLSVFLHNFLSLQSWFLHSSVLKEEDMKGVQVKPGLLSL